MNTEKTCESCLGSFTTERESEAGERVLCPSCVEEAENRRRAEADRRKAEIDLEILRGEKAVDALVPTRLAQTDRDHPSFNTRLWRKVEKWRWNFDKPWLGLVGETGSCKSRCAWMRLRMEPGIVLNDLDDNEAIPRVKVAETSAYEFARLVSERASRDPDRADRATSRLEEIQRASFLLFDELGKVRNTPAVVAELFALLDSRHAKNLLTIWTSNTPPNSFCSTWPEEYAAPTCGRLIECSEIFK